MIDHKDLKCLVEIIDEGSFEAAARKLNVTPGAVSQRIRRLEAQVRKPLLVRRQPPYLTESGEKLMSYARRIWQLHNEMDRNVLNEPNPVETISVAINHDSLGDWFLSALHAFTNATGIYVELTSTDSEQTDELFQKGQVLAAVTSSPNTIPGCKSKLLGPLSYQAVCTKAFAARYFEDGINATSLRQAPALYYDRRDRVTQGVLKHFGVRKGETPHHYIPGTAELLQATRMGLGWSTVPSGYLRMFGQGETWVQLYSGKIQTELHWKTWDLASDEIEALSRHVFQTAKDYGLL